MSSSCDVLVYGGTPSGTAAALRAAREGLRVILVQHNHHLGGMMANGLVQWDALSDQRRCPIFREMLERIESYYRETYGEDSHNYRRCRFDRSTYPMGMVEPGVYERLCGELLAEEDRIEVKFGWCVERVRRRFNLVESVILRQLHGSERCEVTAKVFIDSGYEGDLAAASGLPYRVGREARDEFGEPHAGRLYTNVVPGEGPAPEIAEAWGMHPYGHVMGPVHPDSPATGDRCVQAYNLRPCLTVNPDRGVALTAPPPGYCRDEFLHYRRRYLATNQPVRLLNDKGTYNAPILPGENWDYPDGDWATRERIYERHREFALGLMWYLQNDESVPVKQRDDYRCWYLPADEWVDNGHLPYEMYVRETRRIVARHTLTENDLLPQLDTDMPRSFDDSVAFNDWYMDSHSCDRDGTYGEPITEECPYDGKLILTAELRPGQIPYRSMLPLGVDNLVVSVCVGATHVAWGAVRLEPVLVQLGEVAAFAAAFALRDGKLPGTLEPEAFADEIAGQGIQTRYPKPS